MGVHLHKGKATVSLEASLNHEAEVLEQGNEIILRGVRCQISNIAGGLPLRSLLDNHIKALDTVSGEMVVAKGSGGCHAHGGHGLLLRDGGLALLVGPVATNGTGSKPFAIHGTQGFLGIAPITECNETVSTRAAGLHVPHDTGFRD